MRGRFMVMTGLAFALGCGQGVPERANLTSSPSTARVAMVDAQGRGVGEIRLEQGPHGLLLRARLKGLPPGEHAFHLHEVGQCGAPDFKSAGGHFDPKGRQHGFKAPGGFHAGDLPNIHVGPDGEANVDLFVSGLTLQPSETTLLDADGASIVIHAKPDDHTTDPAGESGDRIACGAIIME